MLSEDTPMPSLRSTFRRMADSSSPRTVRLWNMRSLGTDRLKPTTRFLCHIPDSPKYKGWTGKPMPGNKRWVSVRGLLTRVDRSSDNSEVEQFGIDVENIISFWGQYILPANSATLVSQNCECLDFFFSYWRLTVGM